MNLGGGYSSTHCRWDLVNLNWVQVALVGLTSYNLLGKLGHILSWKDLEASRRASRALLKAWAQIFYIITYIQIPLAKINLIDKSNFNGAENKLYLQQKEVQSHKTKQVDTGMGEELKTIMHFTLKFRPEFSLLERTEMTLSIQHEQLSKTCGIMCCGLNVCVSPIHVAAAPMQCLQEIISFYQASPRRLGHLSPM